MDNRAWRAAVNAVVAAKATGRRPSLLELLDKPSVAAINEFRNAGLPDDAGAILLIQSDRGGNAAADDLEVFRAAFIDSGATDVFVATDATESDMLLESRRLLAPAMEKYGTFLTEDVCVPIGALADLVEGVAEIGRKFDVRTVCAGHAGDGNVHPSIFFDPADEAESARCMAAFDAIMALGLELGGTNHRRARCRLAQAGMAGA